MARLTSFLKSLTTPEDRLSGAEGLMTYVYGPYDPQKHTKENWQPGPYRENKSRYLWTDAFGVVNFISLAELTGKPHYLDQADALIKNVHNILGRQRGGSSLGVGASSHQPRLLGASDDHPTKGGLRIGKVHPEEHPDGDGQYYHYITRWAFALNRMSLARNDAKYNNWAVELLKAVHPHFVYRTSGGGVPKMYWKISIDMKRPMVPSEGNLDPFDGLITVRLLQNTAAAFRGRKNKEGGVGGEGGRVEEKEDVLVKEEEDFLSMVEIKYRRYHSSDPLDLGEALWLTHWALASDSSPSKSGVTMPSSTGAGEAAQGEKVKEEAWARFIATQSIQSLDKLWRDGYFSEPAGYRLAFREFGTTLGVQVNPVAATTSTSQWKKERIDALHTFWASRVIERDMDITPVMMASSLVPGAWDKNFKFKKGEEEE
ncbi:hypothetical protein NADE_008560 [Nannochloris sp. 'desiccata']|nr:hypothetical protein NADE_008560 [Chlorella desiccata (nom. nud.)]